MLSKSSKIFVAGGEGLVGSAMLRRLQSDGYADILAPVRKELDLCSQVATQNYLEANQPDTIIFCAGKMGGVYANENYCADFIYENTLMACNVVQAAFRFNVKRLLYFSCSSVFPKVQDGPLREEDILRGSLEPTSEPFALAKILGMKLCEAYNRQYGTNFVSIVPTNVFGPQKKYHPMNSPVIPALILKCHEAKVRSKDSVELWGEGSVLRDFLYVDDLVDASLFLLDNYMGTHPINVGTGQEISIREVAEEIKSVVGYEGQISFNKSMPTGVHSKTQDLSRISEMGWRAKWALREGLKTTYQHFLEVRGG